MDFHQKYTPKSLDDFFFHRETIENLRKFRDSLTHFRIYSDICNIGRKRILNLYLKEIGAVKEHIFYIDYQNIKTFENKDRLFQFLDSKSSYRKFIIIEHLQSISNKFMNDLINILKQNEAIVCFIDVDNSFNDTEISKYVIDFKLDTLNPYDLKEFAKHILKTENIEYDEKIVNDCIEFSSSNYYNFMFHLESNFKTNVDFSSSTSISIDYDIIFNDASLKRRLLEIRKTEKLGFSKNNIMKNLMDHVYNVLNEIDYALIIGDCIDVCDKDQNNSTEIYKMICNLYMQSMGTLAFT